MKKGKLFVLTGPSGTGVGEVIKGVNRLRDDISFVTPITSRKMKQGEVNGHGFYFYELEEWENLKANGGLLEHTTFAGNDYGTSKKLVEEIINSGRNVLLNLEIERAKQIHENMHDAIFILIVKESLKKLEETYIQKKMSDIEIRVRINEAKKINQNSGFFNYIVFDYNISQATEEVNAIITAESCRTEARLEHIKF